MGDKVISICVVVFIIILCIAACSVDHVEGDDSAWNCIVAIIILLAWLKGK